MILDFLLIFFKNQIKIILIILLNIKVYILYKDHRYYLRIAFIFSSFLLPCLCLEWIILTGLCVNYFMIDDERGFLRMIFYIVLCTL